MGDADDQDHRRRRELERERRRHIADSARLERERETLEGVLGTPWQKGVNLAICGLSLVLGAVGLIGGGLLAVLGLGVAAAGAVLVAKGLNDKRPAQDRLAEIRRAQREHVLSVDRIDEEMAALQALDSSEPPPPLP